jgi:hypothetical protein
MYDELQRISIGPIEILYGNLPGGAEYNHKNQQSVQSVSWLEFELSTFRKQVHSFTDRTNSSVDFYVKIIRVHKESKNSQIHFHKMSSCF